MRELQTVYFHHCLSSRILAGVPDITMGVNDVEDL